jgi:formate hydrogenlyase subunit 4
MMRIALHALLFLTFPPLLQGVINRVKAAFAGRRGPLVLQLYFDLWKLLRKGAVYSTTTTWLFRAAPAFGLAALLVAALLLPLGGGLPAPAAFAGDVILFAYLLAAARFSLVLAALDTGSSFEGMGASREVTFSALAEPALFLSIAALALARGSISWTGILSSQLQSWHVYGPALALVTSALVLVALAENSRIPFDDPNTHLELTMVHEVMILDHSGPDLAMILYGASLKLFLFGAIVVRLAFPFEASYPAHVALFLSGMLVFAIVVGLVESTFARLRMNRVPQILIAASVFAALAVAIILIRVAA